MNNDSLEEEKLIIERLRAFAGESGLVSYKTFIQEALFAPEIGYYRKKRDRVGRREKTDFYTAESLGPIFRKLVVSSIQKIMSDAKYEDFTFVEIGAEPNRGLFEGIDHPFHDVKIIRPGDAIEIPNKAIVFANELLDAQPFHRLIYQDEEWHELGVKINPNNSLSEQILPERTAEVLEIIKILPEIASEGYVLDFPLEAENLLERIVKQNWNGLIMLFDYGFSWEELIYNRSEGTARAYFRHKQSNNLLTHIGNQDITCHICWDRLIKVMEKHGFSSPTLQRQESFFVHNATLAIEEIVKTKSNEFSHDRQTIQELIHPSHMGHKFQVLWGMR